MRPGNVTIYANIICNAVKGLNLACVASVSSRVRQESCRDESKKKKGMTGEGEGDAFKSRLSLIVRVNVVLNRTVVVDSD